MRPSKGSSGYLLDSNVIVHSALAPQFLGRSTRKIITEHPQVFFSPISISEITLKILKRKLPDLGNLHDQLVSQAIYEKSYNSNHSQELRTFTSLIDHDPYDRMLLAQASAENLTFITGDKKLLELGFTWIQDSAT